MMTNQPPLLCYLWFLYFMIMGLSQHNPALNPVSQTEMFGGNGCGSKQRFRGVVHFPLPQNNKTKNLKCNMLHCACNLVKSYASCYTDGSRLLKPAWDHMLQHNLHALFSFLFLLTWHSSKWQSSSKRRQICKFPKMSQYSFNVALEWRSMPAFFTLLSRKSVAGGASDG